MGRFHVQRTRRGQLNPKSEARNPNNQSEHFHMNLGRNMNGRRHLEFMIRPELMRRFMGSDLSRSAMISVEQRFDSLSGV